MQTAKDFLVKPIDSKSARTFIKRWHYSGKVCANSQIHFGAFHNDKLVGVMQYGPSTDKRRMAQNLGIGMNEFLELNRMALIDNTPKNTESRFIAITIKILKKQYPFLRLIISFADACQCGDGTIYRASGFKLMGFKKNTSLLQLSPQALEVVSKYIKIDNNIVSDKSLNNHVVSRKPLDSKEMGGRYLTSIARELGAKPINGYQMKYIYILDKSLDSKFKWVAFDKIPDEVKMYKGMKSKRVELESKAHDIQS